MKVDKLVPKRIHKLGRKPKVTGISITLPENSKQQTKEIWSPQKTNFTPNEQKLLMAAALEMVLKVAFQLHVYSFGGQLYIQKSGGTTGKRLTCPSAKIHINRWY